MKNMTNFCSPTLIARAISAAMLGSSLAGTVLLGSALAQETATSAENANAPEPDGVEVIQVRGIRASMVQSINDKRFADSITDTITATDIGKLPDVTIADSLQRITGVQINRSGGEGTSVNIRGISQVGTTLNGEQMLSAGAVTTVQPNFADVPSTMVSGLDVNKSREAKFLSQGMSGIINLRTYRPFDLEDGYTVNAKAEATDGSMGDETDTLYSTFIGYNNDYNFGATLNITVSDKNLADYLVGSTGQDWGFVATERNSFVADNVDANGNGNLDDTYYSFQGHQASNQFIERERLGVNGSVQWQISDEWQLVGDVFYTEMDEFRGQAGFIASQAWQNVTGWFHGDPNGFTAHEHIIKDASGNPVNLVGAFNSFQNGTIQSRRTMVHSEADAIEREALNTNLELRFDSGDSFTATLRWAHGEARDDNQLSVVDAYINSGLQSGATFNGAGGVPVSDVNPWGYDGQTAFLPDGTPAGDFTVIPIGLGYSGDNQIWNLPSTHNIDGETIEEVFGSNIGRYSATSSNLTGTNRDAELDVFRADASYLYEIGPIVSFDAGIRYASRDVEQLGWIGGVARTNAFGDAFLSRWKDSASQAPQTLESFIDPISFESLDQQGFITQISDFQGTQGLGSLYFVDPSAMRNPLDWHNQVYGQNIQSPDGANSYELEETTSELYLQANLDTEVWDLPLRGNVGFRYVKTELDIQQSDVATNGAATYNGVTYILSGALGMLPPAAAIIRTERDYTDVLPSVNLTLNLADDHLLRFSYGETVTPHNTDDLAGGIDVTRILACNLQAEDGSSVFCATSANQRGNPQLDPWRSTNIDLSYEWYFSESGMFSVAAFYLDIESFITNTTVQLEIADSDGVVRGYDPSTQQFTGLVPTTTLGNGEGGNVKGIEFGYQQGFDFLDGVWKNFGVNANYTFSPSTSGDTDYYGEDTPMIDNSEHQANFAIWYEDDKLQARIAANYRSKTFLSVRRISGSGITAEGETVSGTYEWATYLEPTLYLDASVSYDINENFTVLMQGTNLTEETRRQYYQWEDNLDKVFFNERRLTLGIQYRM